MIFNSQSVLLRSLVSDIQLFSVPFVRFLHIWCPSLGLLPPVLSLVSHSSSHVVENKNSTYYTLRSHRRLFYVHTACCIQVFVSQWDSSAIRPSLRYRQSGNVRPGFSLRMKLADDRSVHHCIENSEQHSLAGTQQCAQMLTSVYVTSNFGVHLEYWDCTWYALLIVLRVLLIVWEYYSEY